MDFGFSADDVFEIAVDLEARGERFYLAAASKTTNEDVRKLFIALARDEIKHAARFEVQRSKRRTRLGGEGSAASERWLRDYLRSWSEGEAFDGEDLDAFAATRDVMEVLNKALELEVEVVTFFLHMRQFMPSDEEAAWVDEILREEDHHCRKIGRVIERVKEVRESRR